MTITVGEYTFEGPYKSPEHLRDDAGIYAIHCLRRERYFLLDIGESSEVKSRVTDHDRKDCWLEHCHGTITYSVFYTPRKTQAERREVEKDLREKYEPVCGER